MSEKQWNSSDSQPDAPAMQGSTRKPWSPPTIKLDQFRADHYISACYNINCQTPRHKVFTKVVNDSNGNGIYDSGDADVYIPAFGFSGCGQVHNGVMLNTDITNNGFVVDDNGNAESVFWWQESLGADSDIHVTVPSEHLYSINPNAS